MPSCGCRLDSFRLTGSGRIRPGTRDPFSKSRLAGETAMGMTVDPETHGQASAKRPPRFGSYLGLFYVAAILGVMGFAVLHETGTGHAYDRLKPGMSPTKSRPSLGFPAPRRNRGPGSCRSGEFPTASPSRWSFPTASSSRRSVSRAWKMPGNPDHVRGSATGARSAPALPARPG